MSGPIDDPAKAAATSSLGARRPDELGGGAII
jgi:hypothetical protein